MISDVLIFIFGIIVGVVLDLSKGYFSRILTNFIIRRAKSRYIPTSIPSPSAAFYSYRIGNFEIPAWPIIGSPETPFHFDEVTVYFQPIMRDESSDFPVELRAAREYLIQEMETKYNRSLSHDNVLPRLDRLEQGPELPGDKRGYLNIYLSLTTFVNQCVTNRSIDYRVIPRSGFLSKFLSNQTIREAYCTRHLSDLSKSILANAPGVDTAIISRNLNQNPKDQLIIRRRSQIVHFCRRYYQVSATGYMSVDHKDSNHAPNPFITAISETKQEVADSLSLSPKDFKLIGLSIDWQHLYPTFYGYIETGLSVKQLLGDFKRDSYEGELMAIPFDPKHVLSHISKEKWTAQGALAAVATLLAFYPRNEVEAVARTLPAKTTQDFLCMD